MRQGAHRFITAIVRRLAAILSSMAVTTAVLAVATDTPPANAATSYQPGQFIAKTYTEALGRAPDQGGWGSAIATLTGNCTADSLQAWGRGIFLSTEYTNLGYNNTQKALTAYRGILSRDPSQTELTNGANQIASSGFSTFLNSLYDSSTFGSLAANDACARDNYFYRADAIPPHAGGGLVAGDDIQSQIDSAAPGSTVCIPQASLVYRSTSAPLTVKSGITLTTCGVTSRYQYAKMARIIPNPYIGRAALYNKPLVKVMPGATLQYLWVDGQRNQPINHVADGDGDPTNDHANSTAVYVEVAATQGSASTIQNNKIENSLGSQTVRIVNKDLLNGPCSGATVSGNLVTGYSSYYLKGGFTGNAPWVDGIMSQCGSATATVSNNEIVDASDVALIALVYGGRNVDTDFTGNKVLQAGNNAFGGLVIDPFNISGASFSGTTFSSNTLWSSANNQFEIALSLGSRPWAFIINKVDGSGGAMTSNTTGTQRVRVRQFLSHNGELGVTTSGNGGNIDFVGNFGSSTCLSVANVYNSAHASGSIQPGWTAHDNSNCIVG